MPRSTTGTAGARLLMAAAATIGLGGCRSMRPAMVGGAMDTAPSMETAGPPDAQMQAVLDQLAALHPRPLETLTAAEARRQPTPADAVKALLQKQGRSTAPEPVGKVEDRTVPGPGGPIPVRIYTPAGSGPFPVLVYYHGGGWVIATLDTYDASARALANGAGAVVVSVEYRKGPEHRFPAAHDDAFAAYRWVVANAASLNGDPRRIAVGGESAGGNLATTVAMMARDRHVAMPVHQLIAYPIASYAFDTPSYRANAMAKPLSRPAMMWFFRNYLRTPADGHDARISPLRGNLRGLPAATVITAEIDPLRSEGRAYADALRAAGVRVDYADYLGVTHEFFGMAAVVDKAKQAQQRASANLRAAFGR